MQNFSHGAPRPENTFGASDVAAVCGVSKYQSAHGVWARISGRETWNKTQTPAQAWGHNIESAILQHYRQNYLSPTTPFEYVGKTYRMPGLERWVATPDATRETSPLIVDAKNYDSETHLLQAMWQIFIYNEQAKDENRQKADHAIFHIVDFGRPPEPTVYRWDDELFELILKRVSHFWEYNILQDIEPEPDAHENTKEILAKLYKINPAAAEKKEKKPTTPEIDNLMRLLIKARNAKKKAETVEAELKNKICQFIGSDYGCEGKYGSMIWTPRSGNTDWDALIAEFVKVYNLPLSDVLEMKTDSRFKKPDSRSPRFTEKKDK